MFSAACSSVSSACIAAGLVAARALLSMQASSRPTQQTSLDPGSEWNKDIDPEQARCASRSIWRGSTIRPTARQARCCRSSSHRRTLLPNDRALRNAAFFAYANNYLIDVKFGIIMDVEASRAIRQAEVGASQTMIERTEACFGIKPEWLAADTAMARPPTSIGSSMSKGCATCPRYRQVEARGWHVLARGLRVRQGAQRLCVPRGQILEVDGPSAIRQHISLPGEHPRLWSLPTKVQVLSQIAANAGFHAMCMRMRVMSLVHLPRPKRSRNRAAIARRSRCCSRTSSAFCRLGRLRLRGPSGAQFEFTLAAIVQNLA